jgi:TolB-like protein
MNKKYSKKIYKVIFVIAAFHFSTGLLYARGSTRIAILDFKSINIPPSYGTIVKDHFEVALYKTDVFNILERKDIDIILKEQNLQAARCETESCVARVGKLLSVEYVVIGTIHKIKNYAISLKFIDVATGAIMFAESEYAETEDELIDASKRLAEKISKNAIKNGIGKKNEAEINNKFIQISANFQYAYPLQKMNSLLSHGYGGVINFQYRKLFISNLTIGFEIGGISFSFKNRASDCFTMIPIYGIFGYTINIGTFFKIIPFVSGGMSYNVIKYQSSINGVFWLNTHVIRKAFEPCMKAGSVFEFKIGSHVIIPLSINYGIVFEKEINGYLNVGIGIGTIL